MPETNQRRENASAAIWDWQAADVQKSTDTAAVLRRSGLVQGGVTALASAALWYFDLNVMAYVAAAIATLLIVAALVSPTRFYAALKRGGDKLGWQLSRIIKWLLLPAIYYLFFLPFGKLFRQGPRDTLNRQYEPELTTYWIDRDEALLAKGTRRKQY